MTSSWRSRALGRRRYPGYPIPRILRTDRHERLRTLLVPAVALCLAASACTEDNDFVAKVGTMRLLFTDSSLTAQSLREPDSTLQVAEWSLSAATLTIDGDQADLLIGEKCGFTDTFVEIPNTRGRCIGGLVVDSIDAPRPITIDVDFNMHVRRAAPPPGIDLDPLADPDGDGIITLGDNCPLVANFKQHTKDEGFGQICSVVDSEGRFLGGDSDIDGTPDIVDNCIWGINKQQTNTQGLASQGLDDSIGDACVELRAEVVAQGSTDTNLSHPFVCPEFRAIDNRLIEITVDFNTSESLDCDWNTLTCEIDFALVEVCVTTGVEATFGCRNPSFKCTPA